MSPARADARGERKRPRGREPHGAGAESSASAAPLAVAAPAAAERAAVALWIALAALALARLGLSYVPSMWVWGLNLQRFLAPPAAWVLWVVATLALAPAIAKALAPGIARAGDRLARGRGSLLAMAAFGAILVLLYPDRVRFVGDFLLRQGTVERAGRPADLFPQALPLDVLLHWRIPRLLESARLLDANGTARLLGAIEAALLALLAAGFARALALRGAAALAAAAIVFFGGPLGMFTGFGKAFAELVVLVAAVGFAGLRVVREGRGLLLLGIAVSIALTLHRSALALLPAGALAYALWWRARGAGGAWRRPGAIAAHAIPLATLAVMLPRIVAIMLRWDAIHLAPEEVRAQGGALRAAFAGTRPADLLSLVAMLSPLALAAPALAACLGRAKGRGREIAFLLTLAAPLLLSMPFIHPAQGLFRDWDDFVAAGESLSLVAAWLVAETLRAAPRFAWLGLAAALAAAAPATQWLAHHADLGRGLARVEALVSEAPRRTPDERAKTWDYLGIRNFHLERWDESARAFAHAAATAPSPRILREWANAEARGGRLEEARRICLEIVAKSPGEAGAWSDLVALASMLRDREGTRRAAEGLLAARPGDAFALETLARLAADSASRATSGRRGPR
jgi:tetratricopeptide (TPR) repeat protein